MSNSIHLVCAACGANNRFPADRLQQSPNCGRCHQALFDGHPAALDDSNFAQFIARTDLPVVVDCWAPWCGPCLGFAPTFVAAAKQLEPGAKLVKLDTEANPQTASHLQIRSIPTLLVFRAGREVARMSGAMPLPQLLQWLRPHLQS